MAGVQNYFHGEGGIISDRKWLVDRDGLRLFVEIEGNQHRSRALDYGSDIGIDPIVTVGDEVTYFRLNEYTGLWTRADNNTVHLIENGCKRVISNRRHLDGHRHNYGTGVMDDWIQTLTRVSGIPIDVRNPDQAPFGYDETPRTRISTFLSYSSANIILAHQVFSALSDDADIDVWFDVAQPGEAPTHKDHAERWLRDAVYASKGFVLLLTRSAAESHWVEKEIQWAHEVANRSYDFNLVILKLDDNAPQRCAVQPTNVIDCANLHLHEIREEMYAGVFRRPGRLAWLAAKPDFPQHVYHKPESVAGPYDAFESKSGIAVSVRWGDDAAEPFWVLEYESGGRLQRAIGRGEDEILDPDIRCGDYVGFGRMLGLFGMGTGTIWMRSSEHEVCMSEVERRYKEKLHELGRD